MTVCNSSCLSLGNLFRVNLAEASLSLEDCAKERRAAEASQPSVVPVPAMLSTCCSR